MFRGPGIVTGCAGVVAAVVLSVVPAVAVPPETGATYKGQIETAPSSQDAVTFVVSKNGNWVRKLRVGPWPLTVSCGSGGDLPDQSAKPARIKKGKLTAHVVYSGDGVVIARATITGRSCARARRRAS